MFAFSSRQLLHVFIVLLAVPRRIILLPRRICKTESPFKQISLSGVTEGETDAISRVQQTILSGKYHRDLPGLSAAIHYCDALYRPFDTQETLIN